MPPRLLQSCLACLFVMLVTILVAAQSPHTIHASAGSSGPFLFMPVADYSSGGRYPSSADVADVNGDGRPDIIVVNQRGEPVNGNGVVGILLGNGDGTFQSPATYDAGGYNAGSLVVSDVNGDGYLDLMMAAQCQDASNCDSGGAVTVLFGNGDGSFRSPVVYSSGGYLAIGLALGDVNGDGKPDLLVANHCVSSTTCDNGGMVSILLGNGDGTFQPPVSHDLVGFEPNLLAMADVNRDGKLDLIVAGTCPTSDKCPPGILSVQLGNGDGTFQTSVIVDSARADPFVSLAVGDLNGDGRPDIVVTAYPAGVDVLLGNGDGTFQYPQGVSAEGTDYGIGIGDVNADGKPDLILPNNNGRLDLLLGNGDGTFQAPVAYAGGGGDWVAIADLNGDHQPDLVVAGMIDGLFLFLNNINAPSTTTALVSSLNPVNTRQSVTYTATVTNSSGGPLSGSVTFMDGSTKIATAVLAGNEAAYSTVYPKKGTHSITATYWGELHVAMGSQSSPLIEYVRSTASKTLVTTSESPTFVGQPVTFVATVTSAKAKIPDGEVVNFNDGSVVLASVSLVAGRANYTTSALSVKTHHIKVVYAGDNTFEASSGTVVQVVTLYPTTTTLSSNPNPSSFGQAVTLTAAVSSAAPGGPTGTVIFKNGTTSLGKAMLSGGTASLTTTKLPIGALTIAAHYNGDASSARSSGTTTQTVR
jgi:Bacterial Ig-like domain (group 3)/FG-GAP-like repeat/FG-GAP repeat